MSLIGKKAKILVSTEKYGGQLSSFIKAVGAIGIITGLLKTNGVLSKAEIKFEDGELDYFLLSEFEVVEKAPERNTYRYLIEVLQHVIKTEHENFREFLLSKGFGQNCEGCPSTLCDGICPENLEDAFADDSIQHVYKSAKLAYWEFLDEAAEKGA